MQDYDRSSKWLIKHYGDSILRMAGVRDIATWKALQAELVQPRRLPDGLIEVRGQGQDKPDYYILEIATYPEARIAQQVVAGLRYDDPRLFELLGGRKAMIESPVLQRLLRETRQEDIVRVLVARFRIAAPDVEAELNSINDDDRLNELVDLAATCPDLDSFRKQLSH
jgi:hypothetical protein